jgi:hypothetical protein
MRGDGVTERVAVTVRVRVADGVTDVVGVTDGVGDGVGDGHAGLRMAVSERQLNVRLLGNLKSSAAGVVPDNTLNDTSNILHTWTGTTTPNSHDRKHSRRGVRKASTAYPSELIVVTLPGMVPFNLLLLRLTTLRSGTTHGSAVRGRHSNAGAVPLRRAWQHTLATSSL